MKSNLMDEVLNIRDEHIHATCLEDLRDVCSGHALEVIDRAVRKDIDTEIFKMLCEKIAEDNEPGSKIDLELINDILSYDEDIDSRVFPEDYWVDETDENEIIDDPIHAALEDLVNEGIVIRKPSNDHAKT